MMHFSFSEWTGLRQRAAGGTQDVPAPLVMIYAAQAVIAQAGYPVTGFTVTVDEESQLSEMLGLDDRLMTVCRVDTGVERLYAVGEDSCWMGQLAADLVNGLFEGHDVALRAA